MKEDIRGSVLELVRHDIETTRQLKSMQIEVRALENIIKSSAVMMTGLYMVYLQSHDLPDGVVDYLTERSTQMIADVEALYKITKERK